MPLFDIFCTVCNKEVIDIIIKSDGILPDCDQCGGRMAKIMNTTSFELKYNNRTDMCDWDGNTSQYWKDIKKNGGEDPNADKW